LKGYYENLDAGRLPVARGLELAFDDAVRRAVIHGLACNFRLDFESIRGDYGIEFAEYFAPELADLRSLAADGMVDLTPREIVVSPRGRLLVRTICMVFDRYLREKRKGATYSRVV